MTGSPPASSTTISGLTNGTAYTFTVTATNAIGTGPASAASNSVTPSGAPGGEWAPLMSWPFEAIHMFLLSTGHVLAFDGWQQPEPTYVWNPVTQAFTSTSAPDSIFCSGMAQLPNGEVMTVGGYGTLTTGNIGIVDTAVFNPATETWKRVADMHTPRWYPDVTELANGDYVAISGNSTTAKAWADTPEVYDPTANTWTALSKVSTSGVHEEEYPFSYLVPNGNVFTIGTSEGISYELNVANQTWTATGGASGITNGSSVMYRPGKILYSGGAPSVENITNSVGEHLDDRPDRRDAEMAADRTDAQQPHLPHADDARRRDGARDRRETRAAIRTSITTGVLPTEIWNPATETWTTAAPIAAARNYHSTAMLMPNGTVLVAGGGHPNGLSDPGQFSAQIYSPAYLSDGPRPTITAAPAASTYNSSITLSTPDAESIGAVNLVSLGADTHQSDMAQHFVPLSFTANSGSLTVQTPANSALAPYGNYMLFIVNKKGVPSVSAPLNLSAAPTAPAAPTGVSATATAGSATVTWTAPAPGTSPITSYTITPYIGTVAQTPTTITGSPPATSTTINGLTNGTTYTFKVTATNAVGTGPASAASNPVTPSAPTAPAAPTGVNATPGSASATVSWTAPAADGSPITSYTITPYIGTTAQPATHDHGVPAGDEHDDHGPDERHDLHIHRDRDERRRNGTCLGGVERGDAHRHDCSSVRAADLRARPRREPRGDSGHEPHGRESPGGRGRRVEQLERDDFERERRGRRHVHRVAALQSLGWHGDERVERARERRRRDEAEDHRHADLIRRRRYRDARILGALGGRGDGGRRPDRTGLGHDQSGGRGHDAGDGADERSERAGPRPLRGLRLREQPDGPDGLQRPCERLADR